MKIERGSRWLKCDLHCHTPIDPQWVDGVSTNKNHEKEFINKFIEKAKDEKLDIIAITDHFFYNKDRKISRFLPSLMRKGIENDILIIPGVEISLEKGVKNIHILILFDPRINVTIIDAFLVKIHGLPNSSDGKKIVLNSNKDLDKIFEKLKKMDNSETKFLMGFAHVDKNEDGILNSHVIKGKGQEHLWNKPYMKFAQWKTTPDENNSVYEKFISNGLLNHKQILHIISSDSRSLTPHEKKKYLGEVPVWLKIPKSFEGLWQLFQNPYGKDLIAYSYENIKKIEEYISKIKLSPDRLFDQTSSDIRFKEDEILFNSGLVTIIGQRGSGKSLLLSTIGKIMNHPIVIDEEFPLIDEKYKVNICKDEKSIEFCITDSNPVDLIYVPQGIVKEYSEKPRKMNSEILSFLNLTGFKTDQDYSIISTKISQFFDINRNLAKLDSVDLKKKMKILEEKIEYLSSKDIQDRLKAIKDYSEEEYKFRDAIGNIQDLKKQVESIKKDLNRRFKQLNQVLPSEKKINFTIKILPELDEIEIFLDKNIEEKRNKISEIKEELKKKDISDSDHKINKLDNIQKEISFLKEKENNINSMKNEINEIISNLKKQAEFIKKEFDKYVDIINQKWKEVREKEFTNPEHQEIHNDLISEIDIVPIKTFDPDIFVDKIKDFLNLSKFRDTSTRDQNQRILDTFGCSSHQDFIEMLKGNRKIEYDDQEMDIFELVKQKDLFKSKNRFDFLKNLYDLEYLVEFLTVRCEIQYHGRKINNLSLGERGTLFLKMKLATAEFSSPFIFDQPENDLDHKYIQEHLVPIFNKIKKFRQIIIATHNANLVVNCHADQVIVAEYKKDFIEYKRGHIAKEDIREDICEYLEGGVEAFKQRGYKYCLDK